MYANPKPASPFPSSSSSSSLFNPFSLLSFVPLISPPRSFSSSSFQVDSTELSIPLSPSMLAIQTCLVDLISVCLKELKGANPLLDADELTPENALARWEK